MLTIADEQVAQLGAVLDRLDDAEAISGIDEGLPGCARQTLALLAELRPINGIAIKLGARQAPGGDVDEDVWWAVLVALARRDVLAQQAAGIDHGLIGDSLRLLDRIDVIIGEGPADGWEVAVQAGVQELVQARERGAARGRELRRGRQELAPRSSPTVGWLLRHPADHWLRLAARGVADPDCMALIASLIANLQSSYDQMHCLDLAAEEAAAEVICETEIVEVSPGGWKEPAAAVVTVAIKGNKPVGQRIGVGLVEDPGAPFNGTVVSLLTGGRWRVCARECPDARCCR